MASLSLEQWLARIEQLHPHNIELGLERIALVLNRLLGEAPNARVVTVAGTNGKGSTVECISKCLLANGKSVASYTSPHLIRFNERIVINGDSVEDTELIVAFEAVDQAREEIKLTYFEFTTLAALWLFQRACVEFWVLEVGLGGRLDAVNIVDAEVAIVTSVGLDHQDWLGDTRELIAIEKSGIMRHGRIAICSDRQPPRTIAEQALIIGASLRQLGTDFDIEVMPASELPHSTEGGETTKAESVWQRHRQSGDLQAQKLPPITPTISSQTARWRGMKEQRQGLHCPFGVAMENIAGGLAALEALDELPSIDVLNGVFAKWRLAGRQQIFVLGAQWWFDVAHNLDSARLLAQALMQYSASVTATASTIAVIGMLADKPVDHVISKLAGLVSEWVVVDVDAARAIAADQLACKIREVSSAPITTVRSVAAGVAIARARATVNDRVVVTGSFHTVGPALAWHGL